MNFLKNTTLLLSSVILMSCSSSGGDDTPTPGPNPGPPPPSSETKEVSWWLTESTGSNKLTGQTASLRFNSAVNVHPTIEINDAVTFQEIDGFGFTLTGGSGQVINQLNSTKKQALLKELFGSESNSISISFLRISIGASDLNEFPFSYNDIEVGTTDPELSQFDLGSDLDDLIPLLQEILAINPNIKILGSPWSAPVWMKDNNAFVGGSLLPEYYEVYANYFVKYIQAMQEHGIPVYAVTPQNEPLHGGNNPSMVMTATEQALFVGSYLGPQMQAAGTTSKIIIWDHNCDRPDYPITVLQDANAYQYIDGSSFHLYAGDISALSQVHNAFPEKNVYFTEQYTSSGGSFAGDLKWHTKNVIIGAVRNWSKVALEWNLANDETYGPHTQGGCTVCKGAITIDGSGNITRNVGYYIVGHASKLVPPGSVRISSNQTGSIYNVAFMTTDQKFILIAENDGDTDVLFNVKHKGKWFTASLKSGAVATYTWK